MPQSAGIVLKSFLKASRPPADAPTPAIGNGCAPDVLGLAVRFFATDARAGRFARAGVALLSFDPPKALRGGSIYSLQPTDAKPCCAAPPSRRKPMRRITRVVIRLTHRLLPGYKRIPAVCGMRGLPICNG